MTSTTRPVVTRATRPMRPGSAVSSTTSRSASRNATSPALVAASATHAGSSSRNRNMSGYGVGLTSRTCLPSAASQEAIATSDPAPSPSALTCVVNATRCALRSVVAISSSAARRVSGTVRTDSIPFPSRANEPLARLRPHRRDVHDARRRRAVDRGVAQRRQQRGRLVLERLQLYPCPSQLVERMRVRPRTKRQSPCPAPRGRALVQDRIVQAGIEALHDIDHILDLPEQPAAAAFAAREWMRHVHDAALRVDPLTRLACRRALRDQLVEVEPDDVHALGGLHLFADDDVVRVSARQLLRYGDLVVIRDADTVEPARQRAGHEL